MSQRIEEAFAKCRREGRRAFVAYACGGDPDFETSLNILLALVRAGVDILEIGVPFSDPMADGLANQQAAERALASGMSLQKILDLVRALRRESEVPIVLFTYLNPVYQYGYQRLTQDAEEAGVDGLLLLDLPPEEAASHAEFLDSTSLAHIPLVAPTTPPERLATLLAPAAGFVYVLSRTGVTGGEHGGPADHLQAHLAELRAHTELPLAVGFGISTPQDVAEVAEMADGVVVGSAIVRHIAQWAKEPDGLQRIEDFTAELVRAAHGPH